MAARKSPPACLVWIAASAKLYVCRVYAPAPPMGRGRVEPAAKVRSLVLGLVWHNYTRKRDFYHFLHRIHIQVNKFLLNLHLSVCSLHINGPSQARAPFALSTAQRSAVRAAKHNMSELGAL